MLLHWACHLASTQPHIPTLLSLNSWRQCSSTARGSFPSKWYLSLTQFAWWKNLVHSLLYGSRFAFRPISAYHEATRGRVLVQLCAELIFLGPFSYGEHPTALVSAFQHSSRISLSVYCSLQHSLSRCDHFKCRLIDSLIRHRRKRNFCFEDVKVSKRSFQVSHN